MNNQDINHIQQEARIKLHLKKQLEDDQPLFRELSIKLSAKTNISTKRDYIKVASNIFKKLGNTESMPSLVYADTVVSKIQEAKKLSTLRKRARSVSYVSSEIFIKKYEDAYNHFNSQNVVLANNILSSRIYEVYKKLAVINSSIYRGGWTPKAKRQSKKTMLRLLPNNWREMMAQRLEDGQFKLPALAQLITGARPSEVAKGIQFDREGNRLRVTINGTKVTGKSGQPERSFDIPNHPIKNMVLDYMDNQVDKNKLLIQVNKANSLTTHLRALGYKIWPDLKKAITCYTSRHAIASDCKLAISQGADPDLASKVLGHYVDKTASYYGSLFQSGGISLAPSNVIVSRPIKNKQKIKNNLRKTPGQNKKARNRKMH